VERHVRGALWVLALLAGLALAAQGGVMLWARHEFTQVESIVGLHATGLADLGRLYYPLNSYPYTISAYTPCFYMLSAALYSAGLPVVRAGRLISFLALLGVVFLSGRILWLHTRERYPTWVGTLAIGSTANLLFWGTAGQVDMLAVCFSLAAFLQYSEYRESRAPGRLVGTGLFLLLAACTKQTMVAAGAAIVVSLVLEDRRRGLWLATSLAAAGAILVVTLNRLTGGNFLDNTLWANVNPMSPVKLVQQLQYLLATGLGLMVAGACGWRPAARWHPLHLYWGFSIGVLLATAGKVGADLNYQIETLTVSGLCAGLAFHRVQFFPRMFRSDRALITLLHVPLLFHVFLNLAVTGKTLLSRLVTEQIRRAEYAALRPYFQNSQGRVLSVEIDPLLHAAGRLEVEPLIYTLLVQAGRVDPEPLRRDLAAGNFEMVLLYENLFARPPGARNPEIPSLPEVQLEEVRKNYRLVAHVSGALLDGSYIYQPKARAPEEWSGAVRPQLTPGEDPPLTVGAITTR